jgi:hypothetical protein
MIARADRVSFPGSLLALLFDPPRQGLERRRPLVGIVAIDRLQR